MLNRLQKTDLRFGFGKCRLLRMVLPRFDILYRGGAILMLDEFVGHFLFLFKNR